jgi:malonate-semialdehyde dehydrogenase (acetylating)/methylmalonate-semialdehyde dehydrogenase
MAARNEHMDELAKDIDMWMTWEPVGPCFIVTPGNIPMHAWSSFVPYALAAGCSVVVSPSRQDPVAAEWICRVANMAGWPDGAINLVHGGREINKYILGQPEIQGLGFIGSTWAGWELYKQCAEMGINSSINGNGKNTVLIMPDADLETCPAYLHPAGGTMSPNGSRTPWPRGPRWSSTAGSVSRTRDTSWGPRSWRTSTSTWRWRRKRPLARWRD